MCRLLLIGMAILENFTGARHFHEGIVAQVCSNSFKEKRLTSHSLTYTVEKKHPARRQQTFNVGGASTLAA
jgi:hypothetical protein